MRAAFMAINPELCVMPRVGGEDVQREWRVGANAPLECEVVRDVEFKVDSASVEREV